MVVRRPALLLAEIAWRWTFKAAALLLILLAACQWLDSLWVSEGTAWALRSGIPPLALKAASELLRSGLPQLALLSAVVAIALAGLWMAMASFSRLAVLNVVSKRSPRMRPLLGLHFLRAAAALAALIGYVGALLLASDVSVGTDSAHPGLFLLVFAGLSLLIVLFHGRVRSALELAALFSHEHDTFGAIGAALASLRRRGGGFAEVAVVFGLLRLGLGVGAAVVVLAIAGQADQLAPGWLLLLLAPAVLLFLLLADLLSLAHLAAWVAIIEQEPPPAAQSAPPPGLPPVSLETGLAPSI